jgi:Tfp pilus assembly protein PilO
MKLEMNPTNRTIAAAVALAVLALAFWMLALSPKREEASKLGTEVDQMRTTLVQHQQEAQVAAEARREFPVDYQRLVVLGKAVPGDDDTASLLVQISRIAEDAGVKFQDIELTQEGAGEAEAAPVPTGTPVSPTEAEASLLPLGASVGAAGLGVMPYTLTFDGNFFEIADFIEGLDSLVETKNGEVAVDGRLLTIDGFTLGPTQNKGFPALKASFRVTSYLTPPTQGVTAGATETSPPVATPAAAITETTP